jgi:hypothetical protein
MRRDGGGAAEADRLPPLLRRRPARRGAARPGTRTAAFGAGTPSGAGGGAGRFVGRGRPGLAFADEQADQRRHLLHHSHELLDLAHIRQDAVEAAHPVDNAFNFVQIDQRAQSAAFGRRRSWLSGRKDLNGRIVVGEGTEERIPDARIPSSLGRFAQAGGPALQSGFLGFVHGVRFTPFVR